MNATGNPAEATLTPLQNDLLSALRAVAVEAATACVVSRTEWAGWLVDPVVCWLELDGADVRKRLPRGWQGEVIAALARAGALRQVDEWQNPADEYDRRVTYEV